MCLSLPFFFTAYSTFSRTLKSGEVNKCEMVSSEDLKRIADIMLRIGSTIGSNCLAAPLSKFFSRSHKSGDFFPLKWLVDVCWSVTPLSLAWFS